MLTVGLMKSTVQLTAQVSLYDVLKHEAPTMVSNNTNILAMNFLTTLGTEVGVAWVIFTHGYKVLRVNGAAATTATERLNLQSHYDLLPEAWRWVTRFFIVSILALLSWAAALGVLLMIVG